MPVTIGVFAQRDVVDDVAFTEKATIDWTPRAWSFALDSADAAAHLEVSFDGTNTHAILKASATSSVSDLRAPYRRVWVKKVAGGAGAVAIVMHADQRTGG